MWPLPFCWYPHFIGEAAASTDITQKAEELGREP